jgi:hypothetical protein
VVAPPFLWLALFFLVPFAIVLKISLSEPATAQPPYRPHLPWSLDPEAWRIFFEALGVENYRTLLGDDLYWQAGLASLRVRRDLHGPSALARLPGRPRNGPRVVHLADDARGARRRAVLDEPSDPGLRLDGDP